MGKTLLVEAVAHELGALLIHLTPEKLRGQFAGKTGPLKLVHTAFKVAMDPTIQPAVIYIDQCETFFPSKKFKDKDGPMRFKKDLVSYLKYLKPTHRVIVIGTTKYPENMDAKDLEFFNKFLYIPTPDYQSRLLIWKHYVEEQLRKGLIKKEEMSASNSSSDLIANNKKPAELMAQEENIRKQVRAIMDKMDLSSLAHISAGYAAGAIARTVKTIITWRRVALLRTRQLTSTDFIDALSSQEVVKQDDAYAFRKFTSYITGIDKVYAEKKKLANPGMVLVIL